MELDPVARANKILGEIDTVLGNDLFADAFSRCIAGPSVTSNCVCSQDEVVQIGWTRSSRRSADDYLFWTTIRQEDFTCMHHQAEAAGVTVGWSVDKREEFELATCWSCSWHVYPDDDRTMTSIGLCSVCYEEIIGYRREIPTVGEAEWQSGPVVTGLARIHYGEGEGATSQTISAGYLRLDHPDSTIRGAECL